jgi:lysophospholipase L1-like esterase
MRVLCLGDSLTESSYPRHLAAELERRGVAAEVRSLGFPGATSRELLAAMYEVDLSRLAPELCVLLVGTNDSRIDLNHVPTPKFCQALESLATLLLQPFGPGTARPQLVLCTPPPVQPVPFHFSEDSTRRLEQEIRPAIRVLGRRLRVPVVELGDRLGAGDLQPGDVHPTEEGYRRIAAAVADALAPWLRLVAPFRLDNWPGPANIFVERANRPAAGG